MAELDTDLVNELAERLRPFKLRLGENTAGFIADGRRAIHLSGGERHDLAVDLAALVDELVERRHTAIAGPGHHAMVTVDPERNHGRASITRRMVPIWSPAALLRAGDSVDVVREEFDLTAAEVAVVAALVDDLADVATGAAHEQLRVVYRERAQLVAVLGSLFPAVWAYSDPAAPEWPVVYVDIPQGQCSWHLTQDDLDLFGHVPQVPADDPRARWDGHTTDEKYERLAALADPSATVQEGGSDA